MHNRSHRRALARTAPRVTREALPKRSHKLQPQQCVLWVPDAQGYLIEFSPQGFRAVEFAELARQYDEDEATSAALTFREITGLRVAVRPYHPRPGGLLPFLAAH